MVGGVALFVRYAAEREPRDPVFARRMEKFRTVTGDLIYEDTIGSRIVKIAAGIALFYFLFMSD